MDDREIIPTQSGSTDGEPLYDLGSGVYAEWWMLYDPEDPDGPGLVYGIVEHHWCEQTDKPGYWAIGSVPTRQQQPVKWDVVSGKELSFEGLSLMPSILCPRCGLHGYITNGKWVSV